MNLLLTVLVIIGVLGLIAILVSRRSKVSEDGVAEFRRQLGALSPDASRQVIRPQQVRRPRATGAQGEESKSPEAHDDGA
jgi:hypothetical protein